MTPNCTCYCHNDRELSGRGCLEVYCCKTTFFLHEIPKGSTIKTTLNSGKETTVTFHHLDGMYSYCTLNDGDPDNVIHLSRFTPLKLVDGVYEIIEDGGYLKMNIVPIGQELTKEELAEREYRQKQREQRIALMRASVCRKQITEAYEILENIRFDYLSDTAFREKIVGAKRELEKAMNDFLLDTQYHKNAIERINKMSPEEYQNSLNIPLNEPTQSSRVCTIKDCVNCIKEHGK